MMSSRWKLKDGGQNIRNWAIEKRVSLNMANLELDFKIPKVDNNCMRNEGTTCDDSHPTILRKCAWVVDMCINRDMSFIFKGKEYEEKSSLLSMHAVFTTPRSKSSRNIDSLSALLPFY